MRAGAQKNRGAKRMREEGQEGRRRRVNDCGNSGHPADPVGL